MSFLPTQIITINNRNSYHLCMDESVLKKHCWRCGGDKDPENDFCRDGKDSVCKPCRYELNAEWAKDNREKLRPRRASYMRDYRAKLRKQKQEAEAKATVESPPSEQSK